MDLYRFESVSHPGEYIVGTRGTGDEGNVWLTKDDGTTQFQYDSTWERQAPAATVDSAQAPAAQQIPAGPVGDGQCGAYALSRRPDLNGVVSGNAKLWADEARAAGLPVGTTPHVGDVMVFQPGIMGAGDPTGHVAYVESVNGNTVHLSEQNFTTNGVGGLGQVTERDVDITDTTGIDFISS
jgi:surface antigen